MSADQVPNDETVDLLFEKLHSQKAYSLKVKCAEGEYFAFQGLSGWDLHNTQDLPEDEGSGRDGQETEEDTSEHDPEEGGGAA